MCKLCIFRCFDSCMTYFACVLHFTALRNSSIVHKYIFVFFKLFVVVAFCLYFTLQTWPEVLSSSVAIFKPCSLSICRTTRFSYRSGVNRSRCKERPAHLDPWRRAQQSYQEYASFLVDFSYLLKMVLRLKF